MPFTRRFNARSRRPTYRRRRPSSTKKIVRRAVRKAKNKIFNKRVRRVVARSAETKSINYRDTKLPTCLQAASTAITQNIWILNPVSAAEATPYGTYTGPLRGNADGQRIGNRVTVVKSWLNLIFFPETYDNLINPSPRPMHCRLWFFRLKRNGNLIPSTAAVCGAGNIFVDGTATTGFVGNLSDNTQRLNPDLYTYLGHRDFKLGFASYNGTGSNTQPLDQYYSNNDYALNQIIRIDVTKYCAKNFAWDDSDLPVHKYTYCLMQWMNADGTTAGADHRQMRVQYTIGFSYKDM